jgi:hypothetical protein
MVTLSTTIFYSPRKKHNFSTLNIDIVDMAADLDSENNSLTHTLSSIQLIQSEHVRYEHISIQLGVGASAPKQSAKTKAFQARFDTLRTRFLRNEINGQEL